MSGIERPPGGRLPAESTGPSRMVSANVGPARVVYTRGSFGDWSNLIPEVAAAISGHLAGDRLSAWVNRTTTRKRGDSHYQACSAWWASAAVVVEVSATRPLSAIESKRFRPNGPWAGDVVVHRLSPATVSAKTWARRGTVTVRPSVPPTREVHDSLELLPEPLRRLTAGGPPGGSLLWDHAHGQVTEEVMAYRVINGEAVVLLAWRGPCAPEVLDSRVWHSRVVETSVSDTNAYSFAAASPTSTAPAAQGSQMIRRSSGLRLRGP